MKDKKDGVNTESTALSTQLTTLDIVKEAINNPECQPEKLREMLLFAQELEADHAKKVFNSAMHAAQLEMPIVIKDATNSSIGNTYAKLDTVSKIIKPVYTRHGFSVTFSEDVCDREGFLLILAHVRHIGNHSETYKRFAPIDDKGPKGGDVKTKLHGCQSSMSYMQRQHLCSIFAVTVSDTDDDGNGGTDEPELITQDQVDEINKYLDNINDPDTKARMLKMCGVETVEEIGANWYNTVINKLKAGLDKS